MKKIKGLVFLLIPYCRLSIPVSKVLDDVITVPSTLTSLIKSIFLLYHSQSSLAFCESALAFFKELGEDSEYKEYFNLVEKEVRYLFLFPNHQNIF